MSDFFEEQKRLREAKKAKDALDDAEYEREQACRESERMQREAARAQTYARSLKAERDEAAEWHAQHAEELGETIRELREQIERIATTAAPILRCFLLLAGGLPPESMNPAGGEIIAQARTLRDECDVICAYVADRTKRRAELEAPTPLTEE